MPVRSTPVRNASGLLLAAWLVANATFAQTTASVIERYPAGSILSDEQADRALKEVEAERKSVDARYALKERACYEKFFATDCLQKAKDERREAMTRMRPIEVEANMFKRRSRAEAHEKEAAERSARREAQANERMQAASAPVTPADASTSGDSK